VGVEAAEEFPEVEGADPDHQLHLLQLPDKPQGPQANLARRCPQRELQEADKDSHVQELLLAEEHQELLLLEI
jgi:hypothetical protein